MGRGRSGRGTTLKVPLSPPTQTRERNNPGEHKVFTDLPKGMFEYEGSGDETVDFFKQHSNFDSLIKSMTYEDLDAFGNWMGGHFMDGDQWKGFDNMDAERQQMTRSFDKILDQATLDHGIVVSRLSTPELLGLGKSRPSLAQLQAMEGQVITANGNMSTGAAAQGLMIGMSEKPVEYKIRINAGSVGAGMWIGDKRIGGWGVRQREYMTNRDVDYRVGKSTYDSNRGVFIVELEYAGRREHDYGKGGK